MLASEHSYPRSPFPLCNEFEGLERWRLFGDIAYIEQGDIAYQSTRMTSSDSYYETTPGTFTY